MRGVTGNTGPAGGTIFPPVPNDDFYTTIVNRPVNINVISGVVGNTAGIDTPGGTLVSPSNAIVSVTILLAPSHGTLTSTGLGTFTYRPDPRYLGMDYFVYNVTDSTGVVSKNTATCYIFVEQNEPAINGPNLIASLLDASNNVYQYNAGVVSTIFTASFPGITPLAPGVSSLAVNRDDNLIYYTAANADIADNLKIFAYDYANDIQFLVVDVAVAFPGIGVESFNLSDAEYTGRSLFIGSTNSPSTYYRFAMESYNPLGPSQTISAFQTITPASTTPYGGIAYDSLSAVFLIVGLTAPNTVSGINVIPDTATILSTINAPGLTSNVSPRLGTSNDGLIYVTDGTALYDINQSDGSIGAPQTPFAADVLSLGGWINQF